MSFLTIFLQLHCICLPSVVSVRYFSVNVQSFHSLTSVVNPINMVQKNRLLEAAYKFADDLELEHSRALRDTILETKYAKLVTINLATLSRRVRARRDGSSEKRKPGRPFVLSPHQ